jgi:hypothetical protein
MLNRVNRFVKNITFNSGLNREKFINNKKIVNKIINKTTNKNKNNNMIIVRKMSTCANLFGNGNNNNNNNNDFLYMFAMALVGSYIPQAFNKKK